AEEFAEGGVKVAPFVEVGRGGIDGGEAEAVEGEAGAGEVEILRDDEDAVEVLLPGDGQGVFRAGVSGGAVVIQEHVAGRDAVGDEVVAHDDGFVETLDAEAATSDDFWKIAGLVELDRFIEAGAEASGRSAVEFHF